MNIFFKSIWSIMACICLIGGCGSQNEDISSSKPHLSPQNALVAIFYNINLGQTGSLFFQIEKQDGSLLVNEQIEVAPPAGDREQKKAVRINIHSKINLSTNMATMSADTLRAEKLLTDEQISILQTFLNQGVKATFRGKLNNKRMYGILTISDATNNILSTTDFIRETKDTLYAAAVLDQTLDYIIKWIAWYERV